MKRLIIIPVLAILAGCGTVGETFPMPSTMKCLHYAEIDRRLNEVLDEEFPNTSLNRTAEVYQSQRNECMWAKAQAKKD